MADEKKLIIDEDWKREAQREKEKVAAQEAQEKKEEAAEEPARGRGELPRGDLAGLINMLTTQALFALGLIQVKGEEERQPDLELARYNIDLLDVIEQKTKGNLTPQEQELLKNTLSDLRMGYVSVANQLSAQQ
jgi:hypothetical protein